ncbi:MAG TPA: phosphoribosylformylglycinamidine synthase I [Candidatus Latescibacteria bacterium]|nr:phosphoribosylformylglycinamidine synthase I [Candidatus Latescibacterota bacterium]
MRPHVLVLRAAGSNCDVETAHAFSVAGGEAERVHVNRVAEKPSLLEKTSILVIPGGFTYGDDVSAGKVLANELMTRLSEPLLRFVERGGLVLGICNGFQVLVKTGLLPGWDQQTPSCTLAGNLSGRFEDRWVWLQPGSSRCVYTRGLEKPIYLPVAHAEGRFTASSPQVLDRLAGNDQVVFRYTDALGNDVGYPGNPNGADRSIAAICNISGRVMGMMPHPERHIHPTHHPQWTRKSGNGRPDGLAIFQNAIRAAQE